MAPLVPRARLRGAAAAPAPVPRRRPSGGGWRGPAWPRSCPGTTPAGGRGGGQRAWGPPSCGPPGPAHLAAREQAVVEIADTVAEAELGHTVVDQQEVPQLGSRRGSYGAEPVRDPPKPTGSPGVPPAGPRRPGPFRTHRFSREPGTPRSHTRSPRDTPGPFTTASRDPRPPTPGPSAHAAELLPVLGRWVHPGPGPGLSALGGTTRPARSDVTSARLSDDATSGPLTPLSARPGRGGAGAARGGPAGPGRRWGRGWAGEAGQGERPRGRWSLAGRALGARLGPPPPARAGSAGSGHRGFPRRSVPCRGRAVRGCGRLRSDAAPVPEAVGTAGPFSGEDGPGR